MIIFLSVHALASYETLLLYTNESFLKTHETLHVSETIEKVHILWVMDMDGLYGF